MWGDNERYFYPVNKVMGEIYRSPRQSCSATLALVGVEVALWGGRLPIALVATLFVAGCAGSQTHLRLLEAEGALKVAPASVPGHDFDVSIRNVIDVGYDSDDAATRSRTALQLLESQCPSGAVVGETTINTGAYLLGRPSNTYVVQIKCDGSK